MKKFLIILYSALSLTAFAQDKKTVAVLDPICRDNSVNRFYQQMVRGQLSPESVKGKCTEMSSSLFGAMPSGSLSKKTNIPSDYVDLGLPSGTLWKKENEKCGLITYNKAISLYESNLPNKKQWEELTIKCLWTWTGNGYIVKGKNSESIFLPADGLRSCDEPSDGIDVLGYYWFSTLDTESSGYAWG